MQVHPDAERRVPDSRYPTPWAQRRRLEYAPDGLDNDI